MRARRAFLYTPGDDQHKIQKALTLGADCVCLDMEDGVALNRKVEARVTIAHVLRTLVFGASERLARINPIGSGLEKADLSEVLPSRPAGIVIPKVDSAEQIRWVSNQLLASETQNDWPRGGICLIAIVETAKAIVNLREIASADPRLEALIFGAEDLAGDMGAVRTKEGREILFARGAVVTFAAASGLQAIDMVYLDLHNVEGLRQEALEGSHMGYASKQIVHPNQVVPVQEAFTPSDQAIVEALRIIRAFNEYQAAGKGAFALDGKMVDMPIIKSAENVLARAQAAGKLQSAAETTRPAT